MGKKRKIPAKCYESIDEMPIYNWFNAHETGDLKYVFLPGVKDFSKKARIHAAECFRKMRDQFIDLFGVGDNQKLIYMLRRDIAVLKIDMHLTGNRSIEVFINAKEHEINMLSKEQPKTGNWLETKTHIEKFMGFRMNPKEVTVSEYYSHIAAMKKQFKPTVTRG